MNFPIRIHAIIDYLAGVMLVASAFMIRYPDKPWCPVRKRSTAVEKAIRHARTT